MSEKWQMVVEWSKKTKNYKKGKQEKKELRSWDAKKSIIVANALHYIIVYFYVVLLYGFCCYVFVQVFLLCACFFPIFDSRPFLVFANFDEMGQYASVCFTFLLIFKKNCAEKQYRRIFLRFFSIVVVKNTSVLFFPTGIFFSFRVINYEMTHLTRFLGVEITGGWFPLIY